MTDAALLDAYSQPPAAAESGPALRVLHVINGEHYAGAERVQDLLSAALPEFGFEVVFAAVKPDQFPLRRRFADAPFYPTPMRGKFDLRPARAVAEIARRERCSLIHTHTVRSAMIGRMASRTTGLPMVHHLHSPTAADSSHRLRNLFNSVIERVSTARIAAAVAVSQSLAEYGALHGIPRKRIHVVRNGVPTTGALAPRDTPTDAWTLGCMALFRPRKGLETLLEAFASLRREGRNVTLRAVGRFETSAYQREVHALVERLGIGEFIDFRGFRSDVAAEFAAMDLFVLPSLFGEGLPMVMLEAMSHGVPVVATRVEGVPEALRENIDGLICPPANAASLADCVRRFMTAQVDWQTVRATAHRRQAEHFSTRSMAQATAQVYRQVLAAHVHH